MRSKKVLMIIDTPDPDLLPLEFDDQFIENIKKEIPELPDQKIDLLKNLNSVHMSQQSWFQI